MELEKTSALDLEDIKSKIHNNVKERIANNRFTLTLVGFNITLFILVTIVYYNDTKSLYPLAGVFPIMIILMILNSYRTIPENKNLKQVETRISDITEESFNQAYQKYVVDTENNQMTKESFIKTVTEDNTASIICKYF